MTKTGKSIRVLIVDDNRDGADALGMLVEALGAGVDFGFRQIDGASIRSIVCYT